MDNNYWYTYVYRRSNDAQQTFAEFTLRPTGGAMKDMRPFGLWSDGETLWVADEEEGKLFAYAALRGRVEAALGQTPGAVIGAHELAALASLTRLEALDLGGNRIADFAPLDRRAGLKVLGRKAQTLE